MVLDDRIYLIATSEFRVRLKAPLVESIAIPSGSGSIKSEYV